MQPITLKGFLREYQRIREHDKARRFCFILGAGASAKSGIPTAWELADLWLHELHEMGDEAESDFEKWLAKGSHGVAKLSKDTFGEKYFDIYKARFEQDYKSGSRYLEHLISKGSPSYGYYVLAHILANTNDNLVITVNFDNLVADALIYYSRAHPIVCGHNNVAAFMPVTPHRPTVIKVHHDIYLDPLNDPDSMRELGPEFVKKLPEYLRHYTPIVIGYGGNDGSLMQCLLDCPTIEGGIYWCIREGETPPKKILDLLEKQKGRLVTIKSFDAFMAQLGAEVGFKLDKDELIKKYSADIGKVAQEMDRLAEESIPKTDNTKQQDKDTLTALESSTSSESNKKPWWHYQNLAKEAKTIEEKEAIYIEGLEELPKSVELLNWYGVFLDDTKKEKIRAQEVYKQVLDLDPKYTHALYNYGRLLHFELKQYDLAEEYYKKVLSIDPEYVLALLNYAIFQKNVRANYDEAEKLYQKCLTLRPNDALTLGNYAVFVETVRKDFDKAEDLYKKSLEIEPSGIQVNKNYGLFLKNVRNDPVNAAIYEKKAKELEEAKKNSL